MLLQSLRAVRAQAEAIVATVDALLAELEAAAAQPGGGPCDHAPERRTPAGRMGSPGAWVCECGVEGGG